MYPRIPWELVTDPKGSREHTLGTTGVNYFNTKDHTTVLTESTIAQQVSVLQSFTRATNTRITSYRGFTCRIIFTLATNIKSVTIISDLQF
jgi:hypothetical protein